MGDGSDVIMRKIHEMHAG